ncbi:MAG: putative porin [Methylococcales bacterium]
MANTKKLIALSLCGLVGMAHAGEKEELLKLRNTTTNLIKQLVKQGVITDKTAADMIKQAEADAGQQAAEAKAAPVQEQVPEDEVRVAYVPDFVKDEIRQQVRSELREEVVGDVMQKAKNEQWGMPNALPEWIKRFKLSGDLRLRDQHDFTAVDNTENSYFDFQTINDRGGLTNAGLDRFINTTDDRQRFRQRLRLGIDAAITEGLSAGVRLATGNQRDPVSTNQTLGNTGQRYEFAVDRAYIKYDAINDDKYKWLTLSGGRIKNPWYTGGGEFSGGSELLWDTDLSFEGFAGTVSHRFVEDGSYVGANHSNRSVYATAGVFPLQESARSSDKWLLGGQVGLDWGFANQNNLKLGVAYYDYINIEAKPNTSKSGTCDTNSRANTASRPEFMQGGNTVAAICNEGTIQKPSTLPAMYGVASDFNIVNLNASYDLAIFAPYHLRFSGDYAKNIGFNSAAVSKLLKGAVVDEETNAWQVRTDFGWPRAELAGHWNVFAAYKHVERDAVFDAFTDSDFHLGGTNTKGWMIGGNYGLMKNLWFTGRWLSADIITGPAYSVDVLQLDVNTQF